MNPMAMMKIKGLMDRFKNNHPKVLMFVQDAAQNMGEGSVIDITITTKDGKQMRTNMKVTADDVDLVQQLKQMNS